MPGGRDSVDASNGALIDVSSALTPSAQAGAATASGRSRRGGATADLFNNKHLLARPAAKDKLKKILNSRKGGGGGPADASEATDPEFVALAKIYSELDAVQELAQVCRQRDSLSHLQPFILNALLYGFRDHESMPGTSSSSAGRSYGKKNSALKVRTPSDPRELSLNGTSHLVKARCEKQLEAFVHEQAKRSVYFALDCAWYLNTSLFTGPHGAYHRTMTLLLSMESVVTSYGAASDLFKTADLISSQRAQTAAAPSLPGASKPPLPDGTSPVSTNVASKDAPEATSEKADSVTPVNSKSPSATDPSSSQHAPFVKAASMGSSLTSPRREFALDTTGDGEHDLRIAFPEMKGSDEDVLRAWIGARSERANIFHAELDFIKCLTDISHGLFDIDREHRRDVLRRELEKLNSYIPQNVYIPTEKRHHRILRTVPEAAHVFSTKERVPYLLVVEVEDLGPPSSGDVRDASSSIHSDSSRIGPLRRIGSAGGHRLGHNNTPAGSSPLPHSSAGGAPSSHVAAGTAPEAAVEDGHSPEKLPGTPGATVTEDDASADQSVPNRPDSRFAFSPEMNASDFATQTQEPGSAAMIKRDSSFRGDTEHSDDRRPPDEDLIKAMGEPWVAKSERIRKESPFGRNPNWRLVSCIVKARDQLRQEMFAQRLIQEFHHIFRRADLPLWIHNYQIIATSSEAGLIETILDSKSIDSIKKDSPNVATLQDYFIGRFGGRGSSSYKRAVRNFVQSMAGYSVVSYLLNIKDRHNGNLMIDAEGHIIHIDFGFLLSNSPGGNMEFERSPFKLTNEMVQVMGGTKSSAWKLFRKLSIQGYIESCRHANKLMLMVDIAYPGNEKMPCFLQGREYVLSNLRERLGVGLSRKELAARMARLIDTAHGNWTTKAYDQFQRMSLGIAK